MIQLQAILILGSTHTVGWPQNPPQPCSPSSNPLLAAESKFGLPRPSGESSVVSGVGVGFVGVLSFFVSALSVRFVDVSSISGSFLSHHRLHSNKHTKAVRGRQTTSSSQKYAHRHLETNEQRCKLAGRMHRRASEGLRTKYRLSPPGFPFRGVCFPNNDEYTRHGAATPDLSEKSNPPQPVRELHTSSHPFWVCSQENSAAAPPS